MESFVVSARKYRPVTFDTVVGQNSITSTLKNAIKNNHLAQSFLFCGPRGVGKTTCARIMAKTINCEDLSENIEACNVCPSCESFNRSASFNVHELDAASNNSVDDIRALVDQVRIPPQVGRYKVYIIDEVHMLSSAAFNAFLKTLEEPPAYAKFILATTEKHKIIPTILSRCQIYDFSRITVEDIAKHLQFVAKNENVDTEIEALHIIAQKADGALRDALSIFDQIVSFSGDNITYDNVIENLNVLDYDYYFKITDNILSGDVAKVLLLLDAIISKGFEGSHFINGFGEHLRNLLVCRAPETVSLIEVSASIREKYVEQSKQCPEKFLLNSLSIISRCDLEYKLATNKRLTLELALLNMCALTVSPEKKTEVVKETPLETPKATKQNPPTEPPAKEKPVPSQKSEEPTKPEPEPEQKESADKKATPGSSPSKAFSISIKDTVEDEKKKSDDNEEINYFEDLPSEEFSKEEFLQAWEKLTGKYKANSSVYAALTKNPPSVKNHVVEILLDNMVQESDLRERKIELLSFLRKQLKNYSIQLNTKVAEAKKVEPVKKAYLPEEKISLMIEKNPDVQKLMDDLDLEVKQ